MGESHVGHAWSQVKHGRLQITTEENQETLHFPRLGSGRWDRPAPAQLILDGLLAETTGLNLILVG